MEQSCVNREGNGLPTELPSTVACCSCCIDPAKNFPVSLRGILSEKIISLQKNVGIAPSYAMGGVVQRRCWFLSHLGLVGDSSSSSEMEASEILWLSLSM